jgi:tripartite-type tricarboxylate transporter receptor subunit TctC
MTHFAGALFNSMAKINAVHVPYKGSGPAEVELAGGQINYMIDSLPAALPNVKSGRTRALATTGSKRFSGLPEIPTVAESGLPGYESKQWWGILVPMGTPQAVVLKLYREIVQIMALPNVKEMVLGQGAESRTSSSPREFMDYISTEIIQYTKIVAEAGIKAE